MSHLAPVTVFCRWHQWRDAQLVTRMDGALVGWWLKHSKIIASLPHYTPLTHVDCPRSNLRPEHPKAYNSRSSKSLAQKARDLCSVPDQGGRNANWIEITGKLAAYCHLIYRDGNLPEYTKSSIRRGIQYKSWGKIVDRIFEPKQRNKTNAWGWGWRKMSHHFRLRTRYEIAYQSATSKIGPVMSRHNGLRSTT
jgi:hypothetical protein